jgi:PKD repeat protein
LSPVDAANIRNAAKVVVYDSLMNWHIGEYDVVSNFSYSYLSGFTYQFTNLSQNTVGQLWDFGSGTDTSANPVFTFPGPGNYLVKLISFNSCDTDTFAQIISPVGIDEYNSEQVSIYPNPVTDELVVRSSEFGDKSEIRIYNVLGKSVYLQRLTSNVQRVTISIADLCSGIYFLKINSGNFTVVRKLIVQK